MSFCGEKTMLLDVDKCGVARFIYWVMCVNKSCEATGPIAYTQEEAWIKWNKRSSEDDKHSS